MCGQFFDFGLRNGEIMIYRMRVRLCVDCCLLLCGVVCESVVLLFCSMSIECVISSYFGTHTHARAHGYILPWSVSGI